MSPLHAALEEGDDAEALRLIEEGVDLEEADEARMHQALKALRELQHPAAFTSFATFKQLGGLRQAKPCQAQQLGRRCCRR